MRKTCLLPAVLLFVLCDISSARGQVSLSTVIDLALRNSPKITAAQADLDKARAAFSEARSAYIPQVSTTGGYGRSTGAPLGVPQILTFSAESQVYSPSLNDNIRASRASIESAQHALSETEIEISEDATTTYISLDNALQRRDVLHQEDDFAKRLVDVVRDRVNAGVDGVMESDKAQITSKQIYLQLIHVDGEIREHIAHLSQLTGLNVAGITTDRSSIPKFTKPVLVESDYHDKVADSEGIKAAYAAAESKRLIALGEQHYLYRPQIALQALYSRVDTGLSAYLSYYPRFGGTPENPNSENSLEFGLQITIPLFNMTHRAKAKESAADAKRALAEANQQRSLFIEGQAKSRNAVVELDARADVAELNQQYAQHQLDALHVQLQAGAANLAGPQATPKDELNSSLNERQKYYDYLNAELQLQQTQVGLLRQQGGLPDWIHQSIGTPGTNPSQTAPMVNGILGSSPANSTPVPMNGTPSGAPVIPITH